MMILLSTARNIKIIKNCQKNIIFLGENDEKYSFKVSRLLYRREGSIAMYNHFNSLHHSNEIVTIPIKCVKKSELLASFLVLKDALSESQNITFVFFK